MTAEAIGSPDLTGKIAWVTGGAQGFGAGAARRLASLGAAVVVSDVNRTRGDAVAVDVGGTFVPCDVSSLEECRAAVADVLERHGQLDIAFLNAGVATGCMVGDGFDETLYRRAMGVNLDGVVFGTQAAYEAMKGRGGDIVATASLAGLIGANFDPVYGANKHAVVGLVRSIGADWQRDHGIRVNALCPGFADTAIVITELRDMLAAAGVPLIDPERVVDGFIAAATSGRSGECWYVQPGRAVEPFRFRGIPGHRTVAE